MSLLGVDQSATGKRWISANENRQGQIDQLVRLAHIDPLLAGLLARLGANTDNLENFLDPKLRNLLPDPLSLKDCDKAAERILTSIHSSERIAVFGDYDVDGATSTALLVDYYRHFNIEPKIYIPDRLSEGYGPNSPAMESLAKDHNLIICVDCGTLAFEPIEAARKLGADVIVLDHHMAGETLPDAIVVNPNRQDETGTLGYLSAAAVVFLVLVEVNRRLEVSKPDLLSALDLVALSTVADVAPLIGVNRAFVRSGLERLKQKERIGLKLMCDQFLSGRNVTPSDIGYVLAPRLNAGGRVGNSQLATQLLIAKTEEDAAPIVEELNTLNQTRQAIESEITNQAIAQIEANRITQNFVFASGENWHPGVLGVVASKLKSHFDQPAIVLGGADGVFHGSARSVDGIDLGSAVAKLQSETLIIKGGGHKMAAGLTLESNQLHLAMARLDDLLARQAQNRPSANVQIDAIIAPERIDIALLDRIDQAGPFGAQAPAPLFAIADVKLINIRILKERHLKYQFQASGGIKFDVLSFGAVGSNLEIPSHYLYQDFHIAVALSRNIWNGKESVTILLEDWTSAP